MLCGLGDRGKPVRARPEHASLVGAPSAGDSHLLGGMAPPPGKGCSLAVYAGAYVRIGKSPGVTDCVDEPATFRFREKSRVEAFGSAWNPTMWVELRLNYELVRTTSQSS